MDQRTKHSAVIIIKALPMTVAILRTHGLHGVSTNFNYVVRFSHKQCMRISSVRSVARLNHSKNPVHDPD